MHYPTPVIVALALLAACAVHTSPGPDAPIAAAPPSTEPSTPLTTEPTEPTSSAPVQVAGAAPRAESWPSATGPGRTSEPPPATSPTTPPTSLPPVSDTPAAVTVAVASVQLMQDCPEDRPVAAGRRSSEADMASTSQSMGKRRARESGCRLNLSLTNAGGRAGQLRVMRVRLLDGKGKRELATVASGTPTRWDADTYVAWDERVAGNTTTQVAYSLADAKWKRGGATDLYLKPYIVEVVVVIDGRKQTVRSAEFVPASNDMIQT